MSKQNESELVVLFKIGDFSGLKEAESVVDIEQYELFVPGKGRLRVRKTAGENGTVFEHTIKPKGELKGGIRSGIEENVGVNASYFDTFGMIADKRFIKKRYVFSGKESIFEADDAKLALPPVQFEVDVFTRFDGQPSVWGKIDVEVQDFMAILDTHPDFKGKEIHATLKISHLSFKPQEAFLVNDSMDGDQKKLMQRIWDEEFAQKPDGSSFLKVGPSIKDKVDPAVSGTEEEKPSPAEGNNVKAENEQSETNNV